MTLETGDLLQSILDSLDRIDYIRPDDIPDIELYMDQVTTFMDSRLKNAARNPEVDKILTKTMINNYAKNDLLPPPVRKKYSREHMLLLIFIYYFKGILSISDIQTVLKPITDRFFAGNEGLKLETIYNEVFSLEREEVEVMKQDVVRKYHKAQETFSNAAAEDQEFLQTFAFICMLSFDVYVKKMLIEKLIDSCSAKETDTTEHRSRHSRSDKK
ncbi:MAG: DUF1836 domain-containing protein [Lachnospiraceae bacterium]